MTIALPPGKRRFVTRYRVIVSVILAGAAAALYVGFTSAADPPVDQAASSDVVMFRPIADNPALRQSRIYAKLKDSFTGVLEVNGVEIPEDQLDRREGLSAVSFTPGPGTETGALKAGPICARVIYWPITQGRSAGVQSFKWCWTVS